METIEYKLVSNPEKSVIVPTDYASKAESLVKLAMENPRGLIEVVDELEYLTNPGILARTASLAKETVGTPESLKLQDEVYLRVCMYGVEEKMSGPEKEEATELNESLHLMIREL